MRDFASEVAAHPSKRTAHCRILNEISQSFHPRVLSAQSGGLTRCYEANYLGDRFNVSTIALLPSGRGRGASQNHSPRVTTRTLLIHKENLEKQRRWKKLQVRFLQMRQLLSAYNLLIKRLKYFTNSGSQFLSSSNLMERHPPRCKSLQLFCSFLLSIFINLDGVKEVTEFLGPDRLTRQIMLNRVKASGGPEPVTHPRHDPAETERTTVNSILCFSFGIDPCDETRLITRLFRRVI